MLTFNILVLACLTYVIFLFMVAFAVEKRAERGRIGWLRSPAGLHAFAVGLLHRLDLLWRGRLCGPFGAGVHDHLPRADTGVSSAGGGSCASWCASGAPSG
jgi:hypothetical protein